MISSSKSVFFCRVPELAEFVALTFCLEMQQADHTISGVRVGGKTLPVVFSSLIRNLFVRIMKAHWPRKACLCGKPTSAVFLVSRARLVAAYDGFWSAIAHPAWLGGA
jgi:hypothetical protein